MNIFRRIRLSLGSGVDDLVSRIENHDAVVAAAIGDAARRTARARTRLQHLQRETSAQSTRLEELEQKAATWQQRARDCANDDRERALECLQRRHQCLQQAEQIRGGLGERRQLQLRLQADIQTAERRLQEMKDQQQLMRARQSTAEAAAACRDFDSDPGRELVDIFDRWEVSIADREFWGGSTDTIDELEQQYVSDEQRSALQAELDALLQVQKEQDHD